jgi:hypothetical protein
MCTLVPVKIRFPAAAFLGINVQICWGKILGLTILAADDN